MKIATIVITINPMMTKTCKTIVTWLPYTPSLSDKLKRLGNKFNLRIFLKIKNTQTLLPTKIKPNSILEASKNCKCKTHCERHRFYIAESSRPLQIRINKHQPYMKKKIKKFKICEPAFQNNSILHKQENNYRRNITESGLILLEQTNSKDNSSSSAHLKDDL